MTPQHTHPGTSTHEVVYVGRTNSSHNLPEVGQMTRSHRRGGVELLCWSHDPTIVGRSRLTELTDRAWAQIEPLLPPVSGGGRRWRDHRQVINAILWKLRTGAPWRDLPERYGPWKTAHERLRLWTRDGTWQKILDQVIVKDDSVGAVEWVISVDSTVVRAHQHAAGTQKRGLSRRNRGPRGRRGRAAGPGAG